MSIPIAALTPIVALTIVAVAIAAPAAAQSGRSIQPIPLGTPNGPSPTGQPTPTIIVEPAAMMIAACDANGDAKVTHAELDACLKRSFAGVEGAGTGSIGYIGYSDWALLWLGDRNALPSPFTIDTDGDNRITLAELEAQFDALFARFDKDKDGVVTRAELLTIKSGVDDSPEGRRRGGSKR
ncbi:MAG: calcium-binding protein [Sphingomonas bacterium]|uniref:EF-hand domain-containing protein n=1 Tax=Sphingomonas bacterium TaxID=1895847 RepID=UPI00260D295E|nr:EF-hand domain-containing protein [Sphingomonas bacterium]MDB5707714.1 calcium-binding protein [Sphingomonas bacterium]